MLFPAAAIQSAANIVVGIRAMIRVEPAPDFDGRCLLPRPCLG